MFRSVLTEDNWLSGQWLDAMLRYLQVGKCSPRKFRLIAIANCREIWNQLTQECREAVELAERVADGSQNVKALSTARGKVKGLANRYSDLARAAEAVGNTDRHTSCCRAYEVAMACVEAATPRADKVVRCVRYSRRAMNGTQSDAIARQAHIIRDIFGNPFQPITLSPSWPTDTAVALARGMYESRDFSAMPILADALQDAGCNEPALLDHCRDTNQTHVRGCWAVDLVLGLE